MLRDGLYIAVGLHLTVLPSSPEGDNMHTVVRFHLTTVCKGTPCIQGGIDSGTSPNGYPQRRTPMIQWTILNVLTISLLDCITLETSE